MLVGLICLSALLLLGFTWATNVAAKAPQAYAFAEVGQSETLWDIAERFATPDQDIRQLIYAIRKVNSLEGTLIRPGDVLMVPVATSR